MAIAAVPAAVTPTTATEAAVALTSAATAALGVGPSVGREVSGRAWRGGRATRERHRQRAPHPVLVVDLDAHGAQLLAHLVRVRNRVRVSVRVSVGVRVGVRVRVRVRVRARVRVRVRVRVSVRVRP